MNRRNFIRNLAVGGVVVWNGHTWARSFQPGSTDVVFRFTVASDGHYGQANTPYEEYFDTIVRKINYYHSIFPSEFVVFNGDIIHDDPQFLAPAQKSLSRVKLPLYVTKGNHDRVSPDVWEQTWGIGENHAISIGERVILLGTTADETGKYLCPDLDWFENQLTIHRDAPEVYIFMHITPHTWTRHGVDCPEFHQLLDQHSNVIAVFNGHDHDQDDIKTLNKVPFLFDGHFGGSWGTEYRGFRVVEKLSNGMLRTYLMNPDDQLQLTEL